MRHRLFPVCSTGVLLAATLALAGWQNGRRGPALTRAEAVSDSIQAAAETIQSARERINKTLAALRNLTERPGDVPEQYARMRGEIMALNVTAARISEAADAMRRKCDAYLADWGRQVAAIDDPDLRGAALERRAATAGALAEDF